MGFSMFSAQSPPIAIDFGTSSVKLLQLSIGAQPAIMAAAELPIPDDIRQDRKKRIDFFAKKLPGLLTKGAFKGNRAICSVPSAQTFIQHMQITAADSAAREELIHEQLSSQTGRLPQTMVIRTIDVAEVVREGQSQAEVICFAIPREVVMRHVELLSRCKIQVIGAHSEVMAVVQSFVQMNASSDDSSRTTLFVDLGWGSTKVAIAHGDQIVFARCIQVGGRDFDQCLANQMKCDLSEARAHRLSNDIFSAVETEAVADESEAVPALLRAGVDQAQRESGESSAQADFDSSVATAVDDNGASNNGQGLSELLDAITDELSMCLRYHRSLFRDRSVDQMIFFGGEARQVGLCKHIAKSLRLPAHLGDPLTSLASGKSLRTPGLDLGEPQPGWAVACGLSTSPADL